MINTLFASAFILASSLLSPTVAGLRQSPYNALGDSIRWDQEFRLDKLPSAKNSAWKLERWGGYSSGLSNGWLKISRPSALHDEAAGGIWRIDGSAGNKLWDGSVTSSVEFRVAAAAPYGVRHAAAIVIGDGAKYYRFLLEPAAMTTYRVELDRGSARLFNAESNTLMASSMGSDFGMEQSKNFLYFGDSGSEVDGASTWEFIRWTNGKLLKGQQGKKVVAFGFERPLNFTWFPDDARQWTNYEKSIILNDLSAVSPQSALHEGKRKRGKWKVLPYATDNINGKALSIYTKSDAENISLPLKQSGLYAIYVGLASVPLFHNSEKSGIRVKLGSESVYLNLFNEMDWLDYKRDQIQEHFFAVGNIRKGESIDFSQMPLLPATVAYVRLVPLERKEYNAYLKEREQMEHRKNIMTIDGHGMLLATRAREAEDIQGHLRGFEGSDYGKWWYQILGADLVHYPSQIGTLAGSGAELLPRWYDEEFVASAEGLIENGVNALTVARKLAAEQGSEFHVMVRPQGWVGAMPFDETFNSRFYYDHPEWRAVDEYGASTYYMSYAVPQVRKHLLNMIRETVEMSNPDGVGILFNRGAPFMLWEEAFAKEFKAAFNQELASVETTDPRISALRARIMTGMLVDLRKMLDQLGNQYGKTYKISMSVVDKGQNEIHGLDIENWIKNGLVDDLAVPPGETEYYERITTGSKTNFYPLILPWDRYPAPGEFANRISKYYGDKAAGIAVWDGDMEPYKQAVEPHLPHLLRYLGRPGLIEYWRTNTMPRPNTFRLTQMGDNYFSGWLPNNGF